MQWSQKYKTVSCLGVRFLCSFSPMCCILSVILLALSSFNPLVTRHRGRLLAYLLRLQSVFLDYSGSLSYYGRSFFVGYLLLCCSYCSFDVIVDWNTFLLILLLHIADCLGLTIISVILNSTEVWSAGKSTHETALNCLVLDINIYQAWHILYVW